MTTSPASPASPATTDAPSPRRRTSAGRQPSEQAIDAAIDSATRLLRLPTFRDRYGEIADAAGREQLSYRAFLSELLLAECDDREERRAARRIREAGFPRPKTLAEFDFAANPAINPATINTLAGCVWVAKGQSLCLIGDSGTGKSHLLIGLGTAAAQAGHRVRYVLATQLVNELIEAADERQLSRTIARYGRVELLCLDELGYMELDRRGAELLFQVLTEREERPPSRSPATTPSAAGPRPSPTHASAPQSSTASPSAGTSSRPGPAATASPTPAHNEAAMRDAFPLPPNRHGQERTGLHCQCCGQEIVLAVEDVFALTPRGSAQRFCGPACRQAPTADAKPSSKRTHQPNDKAADDDNSTPPQPQTGPNQTGRIPAIVATPELFGSCDGSRSAGCGAADGEAGVVRAVDRAGHLERGGLPDRGCQSADWETLATRTHNHHTRRSSAALSACDQRAEDGDLAAVLVRG